MRLRFDPPSGLEDPDAVGHLLGVGDLVDSLSATLATPDITAGFFPDVDDPEGTLDEMWRHDAPETARRPPRRSRPRQGCPQGPAPPPQLDGERFELTARPRRPRGRASRGRRDSGTHVSMDADRDDRTGEPTGMFMEALRRGLPPPPAARTLGFEVLDVDPRAGTIVVAFDAGEALTNPFGEVLGGFLAAMLYDTVGPAVLAKLSAGEFIATSRIEVEFLRPAQVGRLVGRGRIVDRDGDDVDVDATLSDPDGGIVATATASIEVVHRAAPGSG